MMSLLWADGFDCYGSAGDLALMYGTFRINLNTTAGRFGGCAVNGNGLDGSNIYKLLATPETDVWVGLSMKIDTGMTGAQRIILYRSNTGAELSIVANNSTRSISVYRGDNATLLATSTTLVYQLGIWTRFEARCKFHGTSGEVEVWIDGTQVISLTGINTKQNSGETGFTRIDFLNSTGLGIGTTTYCDDLTINNTSGDEPTGRLGDLRIAPLFPTSDATPNNGTPSTGTTHYTLVDDNPGYNSSDYIDMTNTTGQEERFGHGPLPTTPSHVFAVSVVAVVQKSDAGDATAHLEVVSSGVAQAGASFSVPASYNFRRDFFTIDPNTSSTWSAAAVNAMKIGYVVE
jgi:hypothetical protein